MTTTVVSDVELQAQVPAADIASVGTATITINQQSNSVIFEIVSGSGFTLTSVPIQANDMAWDPVSGLLYLSIQNSSPTNPNTITTLNPSTGQIGVSVAAGTKPDHLAISGDGSTLYSGIDGSASVQQFSLPALSQGVSLSFTSGSASYYAMDIEVAPDAPNTLAVLRGTLDLSPPDQGGVAIYDGAVQRSTTVPGQDASPYAEIDSIQWGANASNLYGEDDGSTSDLYVMAVNSDGVQIAKDYPGAFTTQVGDGPFVASAKLHYDATTGNLYSDDGQVVNPSTGAVVGSLGASGLVTTDGTLGYVYMLGETKTP